MPPALDRFIASLSAFGRVSTITRGSGFLSACSHFAKCYKFAATRRGYSEEVGPFQKYHWPRWKEAGARKAHRPKAQQDIGTVDEKNSSQDETLYDVKYWATTLAHEERLKRLQGIKVMWRARCYREYRLPTDDTPDAEFLWGTFIKNPNLVTHVIDHAVEILQETDKIYPRLYESTMHYWLPRKPELALDFHHEMVMKLSLKKLPLRDLARTGSSTFEPPSYEALMEIYRNSNERDLFDEVVPVLIEKGYLDLARRWYTLCMLRHDQPSELVASHPVVQIFSVQASTISKTRPEIGRYDTRLMQRLMGRDIAPVRLDDSFCARMFATRTFHPASIIQGLVLVGVNEIGPRAVLAMASRTLPIEELPMRFEELKAAGITLQSSVFSLALEKFAMERKWQLVRSMLDSDQHPDVFGNSSIQRKLLAHYLDQKDFVQAQRTLAILTLFHKESSGESWNLLLQVHIQHSGPLNVMDVLHDMQARGIMLTDESINIIRSLLRPRQRGHKPALSSRSNFDDVRFVTRVYIIVLESGIGAISPTAWREIICRFGMLGRLRELRRLLLWLLCWYAPRDKFHISCLPESPFLKPATAKLRAMYPERRQYFQFPADIPQYRDPFHPIRRLFRPAQLQALISWGFKAGLLPTARLEQSLFESPLEKKHHRRKLLRKGIINRLDWSVGLQMVVQLRDLGVHVHRYTVIKALQMQFINLFGRGRSYKKENRIIERANSMPYAEYVQEVNRIWGSPLFRVPQLLGKGGILYSRMWHPRLSRKMRSKPSINLAEYLGPDWQNRIGKEVFYKKRQGLWAHDALDLDEMKKHFDAQKSALGSDTDLFNKATKATTGAANEEMPKTEER